MYLEVWCSGDRWRFSAVLQALWKAMNNS